MQVVFWRERERKRETGAELDDIYKGNRLGQSLNSSSFSFLNGVPPCDGTSQRSVLVLVHVLVMMPSRDFLRWSTFTLCIESIG